MNKIVKKLKILIYDTNYVKGLPRIIPITKIKYWNENNCDITIICTKDGKQHYESQLENIHYIILPYTYHFQGFYSLAFEYIKINLTALLDINKLIGNFDIVYSQSSVIDFLLVPFILKIFDPKIKWFVVVDNTVPSPNKRPGRFILKLIPYVSFLIGELLLKKSDVIFVVTDFLKHHYEQLKMRKVVKTNNGLGIETKIFTGRISQSVPKINALYCGRFHIAKGIFDLIEVVKIVKKYDKKFKIGILGDGDSNTKHNFINGIKINNLVNNFIIFGYLIGKKKGDIYRNCNFYMSLSYDESYGHAILEALACNKLVIAYNLESYRGVFKKYIKTGQLVLFEKKDISGIAKFIIEYNFNKLKFKNKLSDYTWDNIVKNELKEMRRVYINK